MKEHAVTREPALESAGLVLRHRVLVVKVDGGQVHRGTVAALHPDVTIELDRAKWSGAFRMGDRVRAMHPGRQALEATVGSSAHGTLLLRLD